MGGYVIHLVTGRQGSGKTLYLVKLAYNYHLKGKKVYSNVHLNFPYEPIDYNDIIDCKYEDAIVIIDEIHRLLPSRLSATNKVSKNIVDGFLSMVRKKRLEVYGTTQHIMKVDIRYRTELDYHYICNKYVYEDGGFKINPNNNNLDKNIPVLIKIDVIELMSGNNINFAMIGNDYFDLYDTSQIIEIKGLE